MKKKYISIDLDKTRNLLFTLNALQFIEQETGRSFLDNFTMTSVKDIAVVLFAGLKHEDKSLTIESVGDMVDLSNFKYVSERIQLAFGATMPKSEPKTDVEVTPAPLPESQP